MESRRFRASFAIVAGTVAVFLFLQCSNAEAGVTTFRVYNEKRILDRLSSAPLVSNPVSFSHRSGVSEPLLEPPADPPLARKKRPGKRKKRIRKVIRVRTTTTQVPPNIVENLEPEGISPINNYNNRDIEKYEHRSRRTRRKRPQQGGSKDTSDLQRAESGNPFVNSSAPISTDFSGDGGGLQFHIQILHPLLNGDSVLSHHVPKVPDNKTIKITHELSEEVAGETPVAPDLKKVRRKHQHPLQNPDSVISGQSQVSKNEPSNAAPAGRRKVATQAQTKTNTRDSSKDKGSGVTYVEPFNGRPTSTLFPPVTSQVIPVTRQRSKPTTPATSTTEIPRTTSIKTTLTTTTTTTTTSTTTTARPTIRLTNAPSQSSTSTTTQKPSTVVLSLLPYTPTIPNQSILETGNPQVIIFPPEEDSPPLTPAAGPRLPTTNSPEQEILNQLLGLGQSTSNNNFQRNNPTNSIQSNTNFFDLFNLFQSTTPASTPQFPLLTTPKPSPIYPGSSTVKPRRTTEIQNIPTTLAPATLQPGPTQSQAELDNMLQLALLEGLIQGNSQGPARPSSNNNNGNANDLSSLLSFLGGQSTANLLPQTPPPPTQPPPPPPSNPSSLQAALSNMFSILTNPFGQQQRQQQQQPVTNIFGGGGNLFGGGRNTGTGLFGGGGNSLFSGGNNGGLLGGNSLFNLSPGASSQRTTVVPHPSTTPAPTVSEHELLAQLLQLGIANDQQERNTKNKKASQKPQDPNALDIQSILAGNVLGSGGKGSHSSGATQQPSETMQLLNILFNNNNPTARPSGPYWWLDMNSFMGKDQHPDPMSGVRPKLGQREYFIKVRR